ncbi:MAG: apolipoprotein N-acyltransferase [Verrucomicrobia bacterium]|nr:apolipoprotein N-acyltransferase [Verrucomicrobiota bacterium]
MKASGIHKLLPWVGALLTSFLLIVSYPPFEQSQWAWFALVPLICVVAQVKAKRAALLAFVSGAIYWLFTMFWLTRVTVMGWFILCLYCALYLVPFAVVVGAWLKSRGCSSALSNLGLAVTGSAVWAGFEYLRSVLFTGFAWNPLAVSQFAMPSIIQSAQWGGVYMISALIVFTNIAIACVVLRYIRGRNFRGVTLHPELLAALLLVLANTLQGVRTINNGSSPRKVRIATVQPNIPQYQKWTAQFVTAIYDQLDGLSRTALRVGGFDLLVWPETALPDFLRESESAYQFVHDISTNGVPLLVGSMDMEWKEGGGKPDYYNSSFLVATNGIIDQVYDKQHLVMFGEYVPLEHFLPFLTALTPIQESFSSGDTSTVFRLDGKVNFSVLICFEDVIAKVARSAVRNGARMLVNQTNDAWFDFAEGSRLGYSWGPRQHMAQCVFRAVENRVPVIRSSNTGVSCGIDRLGRVHDILDDGEGRTMLAGFKIMELGIPAEDMSLTWYTRNGDVFGLLCALVAVGMCILTFRQLRTGG